MKRFVVDTNVLLADPNALEKFGAQEVVVPIYAIEEIDRFKRELSERGRNARQISRYLDELRDRGGLSDGVANHSGGRVRVAFADPTSSVAQRLPGTADDLILAVALNERERQPDTEVIFVTRDVNLRIRADALGVEAVDYREQKIDIEEVYGGTTEVDVDESLVDKLYSEGTVPYEGLRPNQYALLRNGSNSSHTALGRFDAEEKCLRPVRRVKDGVWGIRPRNKEQHFALDALLDDSIQLVTLIGKAGTGKTLLAIAAGLLKVAEERKHRKLLVSRPIFPLGRDIGFLPGDIEEKLNPWMQPIYDNLELLLGTAGSPNQGNERSYREFIEMGFVQVEPLTYIRGRSIPNQYIIVDEAQNLTSHEVKTIITRVGEGTKIVLTGDPYQIDNPYVDAANNGLSTVVEKFKDERLAAHLTLMKGERSDLAELATNIL